MDDRVRAKSPEAATRCAAIPQYSPQVEALTVELLGQIADKWTMLVLEELAVHDVMRFTELRRRVTGISQKMLTQTLRRLELNGLIERQVHAVIPPKVEYRRTALGHSLGAAVCGLWTWVEENADNMQAARSRFAKDA
jgi:DNA-binding HxlR family transcriptional regulator